MPEGMPCESCSEESTKGLTKPKKRKASDCASFTNTLTPRHIPEQVPTKKASTQKGLDSALHMVMTVKVSSKDASASEAATKQALSEALAQAMMVNKVGEFRTKPNKNTSSAKSSKSSETSGDQSSDTSSDESPGKHAFLLRTVKMVRPSRWVEFQCERLPNFAELVGTVVRFAGYVLDGGRYEGVCYLKHPTTCARENSAKKLVALLDLGLKGKVVSLPGHPKLFSQVYSKKLVRVGDEPAQGSRSDLGDSDDMQEIKKRLHARLTQLGNRILRETNDTRTALALGVLHEVISSMTGKHHTTTYNQTHTTPDIFRQHLLTNF